MYYYKEVDGNITRYTADETIAKRHGYDKTTIEEIVPCGDKYVLASQYVEPLDEAKADKIAELKAKRDELEVEDIPTPYGTFDYDSKARERINAAIIALDVQGTDATISWTLADNTEATVTSAVLRNVIALIAQRSNELHVKYRTLADTVRDCTTADAVKAVVWE